MTVAIWPVTLPQCLDYGYSEQLPETTIRSQMDYGPDKIRRRTTVGVGRIRGTMVLTKAEATTFADFIDRSIAGGALPFTWKHPRTGADALMRFAEPPSIAQISPRRWQASMTLEVLPAVTDEEE